MIQRIRQMPHPTLRQVAQPFPVEVSTYTPEHVAAIQDLRDTFAETRNCIGLAANQIGALHRVIVVDVTESRGETYVMVNPVIIKASTELQLVNDGCMSVFEGKKHASTKRPKRLTVTWLDPRHNELRKQKFTGLLAACIHHEIDHLDGVLFVDKIVDDRLSYLKSGLSIVRQNLLSVPGYTPYCGNAEKCTHLMPRTKFNGQQFECECGWVSQFEPEFIDDYKNLQQAAP